MKYAFPLLLLLFTPLIFADGAAWVYRDRWDLQPETNQYAIIDFENGYQRFGMTIEMDTNLPGQKAVWVLPIPASPTSTDINLVEGFPAFSGTSISKQAGDVVIGSALLSAGWSTFPLSLPLLFFFVIIGRGSVMMAADYKEGSAYYSGISIYERVQLGGVTSDLVATDDPRELTNYLESKGIDLNWEYRSTLGEYVGKEYSFVITYISDWEKFLARDRLQKDRSPLSLKVNFPSDKPYFPLKLTSLYGDISIPITIVMVGNFKPELYSEISSGVKTEYYRNGRVIESYEDYYRNSDYYDGSGKYVGPERYDVKDFFRPGRNLNNLEYTKIEINSPSRNFKDDLWFSEGLPIHYEFKKLVADNFWAFFILTMAIISALASIAAGRLVFKEPPISDQRLALHGLWNFSTMVGFILATVFWNTRKMDGKLEAQLKKKNLSTFDSRKLSYMVLFYFIFLFFTFMFNISLAYLIG